MATLILKEKIKAEIDRLEDEWMIMELAEMLGLEAEYEFSPEELKMIEAGREDIAAGRVKSHEEVMEGARKWIDESYGQYKQTGSFDPV